MKQDRRRTATLRAGLATGTAACILAISALPLGAQQPARREAAEGTAGWAAPVTSPGELSARLERILADPALLRAHVGFAVQVAETGETLFESDSEKRFVPASNTKLVTGAVALDALGPDFRWKTRIVEDGPVSDGTLQGDLWIVGGGDPLLTRDEVEAWAGRLARDGIRRIAGSVIGDDRAFEQPQWGEGWMWGDLYAGWGAGVSALEINPNTIRADLVPGATLGAPARMVLRAPGPDPGIRVDVRTGAPGSETRLRFLPPPEGGPVRLAGWIPVDADSVPLYLATRHPTLYLLDVLSDALAAAGIEVDGQIRRATDDEAPGTPGRVREIQSEPLASALREMLKPSDNQIAETLLRTLGMAVRERGSAEAGLEVVDETLAGWGIAPDAVELFDGSGLSRYNQVTPAALARLLRALWRHPQHAVFMDALPVAGVDGTLRRRLLGTPADGDVRAKTGSLSSVRALSGYLTDGSGETLVFSLLLNGYDVPGDVATALEDLLIEQVALYRRAVEPGWPSFRDSHR